MTRRLFIDGIPVKIGQIVTDFRGETAIVTGWQEPHKPSSSGRIYVKFTEDQQMSNEYYPSVYGAEFKEENNG